MCECAGQITSGHDGHVAMRGLDPPIRITPKQPRYLTGQESVDADTAKPYEEAGDEDDGDAHLSADGISNMNVAGFET